MCVFLKCVRDASQDAVWRVFEGRTPRAVTQASNHSCMQNSSMEKLKHGETQVLHTDDAHVRPPPKATIMNGLPFVIFPARHSSSRQSGTLPALELP